MFKLFEQHETKTYPVDMNDANVANIVPGSILVLGSSGARLAIVTDIPTQETQGQYLIASDYAQNSSMTSIHGYPGLSIANIAAIPLGEPFELAYDFDGPVAKGDKFVIYNGEIVPVTNEVYAPSLAIFEAIETSFTGVEVMLRATGHPGYTQPQLYIISDAGMVEGEQTCTLSLGCGGVLDETEVEDENNWTITNMAAFFTAEPAVTVDYVDAHEVLVTFDAGNGNTIGLIGGETLGFTLDDSAITGATAPTDELTYELTPDEEAVPPPVLSLFVEDDTGMLEGAQTGTLVMGILGGAFDETTGLVEGNWTIDADAIGSDNTVTWQMSAIAADGSTATIAFDAGAGQTLTPGTVEITASNAVIVGANSGELEYTYDMPRITFTPDEGYYDATEHAIGEVLGIQDGAGVEAGVYTVLDVDDSIQDHEVLTLKHTSGDLLNYNGIASSLNVKLNNVDGDVTVAGEVHTLTLDVEAGIDSLSVGLNETLYFYWTDNGDDKTTIGTISSIAGESPDRTIVFTENGFEGNPTIPTGTPVVVLAGYHAGGMHARAPINQV